MTEGLGLIGLGAVGTGLAMHLVECGYHLIVADARPRAAFEDLLAAGKGKLEWATAEDLCQRCSIVMTSLPSVAIIAQVAEKCIFPHMRSSPATWIDLSTVCAGS